jgi:hypothetical protein
MSALPIQSPTDLLISLVVNELKTTSLGQDSLDMTSLKIKIDSIVSKLDPKTLDTVNSYLTNDKSIVTICVTNLEKILKDGKLDLNDYAYFLDILKNIYIKVKALQVSTITIDSDTVVDLCSVILNVILAVVVPDANLPGLLAITNTVSEMIKFSMNPISTSFKCCC